MANAGKDNTDGPGPSGKAESVDPDRRRWEADIVAPFLKRSPERQAAFETSSGIPLQRVYGPASQTQEEAIHSLGFPGEDPFTRGIQPTMYRGRYWTMRQYAGFGTAEKSNERYHYLLSQGQSGLSVAFDLPTQMGFDSDHPMAAGEVGRTGVAIDSIEDMEVLLRGLPLDQVSTSMTINATAAILLSMYIGVAERRGISAQSLRGTLQNDILKEYIARGTYIYPPRQSMRLITDTFAYCRDEVRQWNTISISGYHIREAGSTAVQEVAFTLGDGIAYVEAALSAGLQVDEFAPQLSFFFNVHNNFLEEVAKFRAARRLWARIMKDRFKAQNPKSRMLRFHTQTAGSTLTAQQPHVNVVRVALQALAAVMGGTQSLHTNALDEALALPTSESALLALRTQQVIALETGAADVVDPLGGSWAIESLTDEIESRSMEYLQRIDDMGGMVRAIEAGFPQREVQEAAYAHQLEVERGHRSIVGVNAHVEPVRESVPLQKVDPSLETEQCARVRDHRSRRRNQDVQDQLARIQETATTGTNLMPPILEAVRRGGTLGEIAGALRTVFGVYEEKVVL